MSYQVRQIGTVATLLPQIKRAVSKHTDGRSLAFFPDTNLATANGEDVTGTAKFYIYASDDSDRDNWTQLVAYTPTQAGSSSTKRFIGSMAVNSDNDVFVAYQGTDNSLRMIRWNWNGASYDAGTSQTVVAANAVTNRYRAIDIDVSNASTGTPAIIVYEASASTGQGAHIRVYIRLDDASTWRKAYEVQIQTTGFIKDGTEDVSVSFGADGISSNVGRLALYWTVTSTTVDSGDVLREISFNTNTGTDGSATVVGTWATGFNANVTASRRGWIFKNETVSSAACWVFGGVVGQALPFYLGIKLHHNSFTYQLNRTTNVPSEITSRKLNVYTDSQRPIYASQSCSYSDQRLQFLYVGVGGTYYDTATRCVVLRWDDDVEGDTAVAVDTSSRFLDNNYSIGNGSLAIYGGANLVNSAAFQYTSIAVYGEDGTDVSAVDGVFERHVRAIIEDTIPAPVIIQPVLSTVGKNRVDFQAQSPSSQLYHMVHGRLEITVATDAAYTTDVVTVVEGEDSYRVYESINGLTQIIKYITYTLTEAEAIFTGDWYLRARIIDDMGGASSYYEVLFSVAHPPAALPRRPTDTSTLQFASGDIIISWDFSDTEPTDVQTAYQIVLTRLDTAATVTDTGKVSLSTQSATLTVSSSLRDIPLAYTITLWDSDDNPGTASNPVQFTLSDPPVVVITSPLDGDTVTTGLPTITWTFTATGRTQTHYRVVVTDTDASPDEDVADTGWISSSASSHTFLSQILTNATNYKVLVYVRDSVGLVANAESNLIGNPGFEGNTTSGWTPTTATVAASSTFKRSGSYAMRITPSGGCTVTTASYPVTVGHGYTGTFYAYSVAGWNAVRIRIDWRDVADAHLSYSDSSATIGAGTWTQYTVTATAPASATQARIIVEMTNSPTGTDLLYVDDVSLVHVPTAFDTSWVAPDDGDITVVTDTFKATISWTNANQDIDFAGWRVYRRYRVAASDELDVDETRFTWVMIYETTDIAASYEYRDYFAPLNKSIDYAVVQLADRFGSALESDLLDTETVTIAGDRYYFVPAIPIGSIASFEASNVTADSFTREVEQEVIHVLDRGRQVQIGDDLGYIGSFTIKLRNPSTARSDREFIELMTKQENGALYIRSPFGDVLYVAFGSPSFSRLAGVGLTDMGDLTVPYVEVFSEVTITRAA